jgi:hypothetical protein
MGGEGKGWDVHLKVEPAKEKKKEEEDDGGGDGGSGWVIAIVVLGLFLAWWYLVPQNTHGCGGASVCAPARHPGYSCAGGGPQWGWGGCGHDRH